MSKDIPMFRNIHITEKKTEYVVYLFELMINETSFSHIAVQKNQRRDLVRQQKSERGKKLTRFLTVIEEGGTKHLPNHGSLRRQYEVFN